MSLEFQDHTDAITDFYAKDQGLDNSKYWAYWDAIKHRRIKLKWGIFRPSFRLYIFEPVIEKLLGPRPT